MSATDKDTVEASGEITYTIFEAASSPSTNIPFSLNRNTGELKTNKEIKLVLVLTVNETFIFSSSSFLHLLQSGNVGAVNSV